MIGFGLVQLWRMLTLTDPGAVVPMLATVAIGAIVVLVVRRVR